LQLQQPLQIFVSINIIIVKILNVHYNLNSDFVKTFLNRLKKGRQARTFPYSEPEKAVDKDFISF